MILLFLFRPFQRINTDNISWYISFLLNFTVILWFFNLLLEDNGFLNLHFCQSWWTTIFFCWNAYNITTGSRVTLRDFVSDLTDRIGRSEKSILSSPSLSSIAIDLLNPGWSFVAVWWWTGEVGGSVWTTASNAFSVNWGILLVLVSFTLLISTVTS